MPKTRRQFSIDIIKCDGFIQMPATAQALYMQLIGACDDEGFTSSIEICKYMAHATDEDEQFLIKRRFILQIESEDHKITIIKHWRQNCAIRSERVTPSLFAERNQVYVKPNGSYTLDPSEGSPLPNSQTLENKPNDKMSAKCTSSVSQVSAKCLSAPKEERLIKEENNTYTNTKQSIAKHSNTNTLHIQSNTLHGNTAESSTPTREEPQSDLDWVINGDRKETNG